METFSFAHQPAPGHVINLHLTADTEADTCRKLVTPKLRAAGWHDDQLLEQQTFTAGKVIVLGRKARTQPAKKADYLLRYRPDFLLAVVEAKSAHKAAGTGMQQAREYATILGLTFAYATNGTDILEFDFSTGIERAVERFPAPEELWQRLHHAAAGNALVPVAHPTTAPPPLPPIGSVGEELLLAPLLAAPDRAVRYYQRNAVNAATAALLAGRTRLLLTLATGTGKTLVAFQLVYRLWHGRWTRTGAFRRPRVLFLADRSILIDDPHTKDFAVFGEARCLVPVDGALAGREIYFSTYHSLADAEALRAFAPDFFDLIIVDECHRGSAAEDGSWRAILDYFRPAAQLGLTATPRRHDNVDTYRYFGNPLYTYSLRQGIADGFLAPYLVHRVVTDVDAAGFRPDQGELDAKGNLIPDDLYTTPDFETSLSHLPRTRAVAHHLTEYLRRTGRFGKTIVFCVDQPHADDFRRELANANADLTAQYPDYCVRITADEGDIGKRLLSRFMDVETTVPVVVTTSKLLSTGVDVPTCANIVIFRQVGSMTEFKQIIGRGTRLRADKDKLFFTVLDYTGAATRKFADPDFDGDPPLITSEAIDADTGEPIPGTYTEEQFPQEEEGNADTFITDDNGTGNDEGDDPLLIRDPDDRPRKFYKVSGTVHIVNETVQVLDGAGKLRTLEYRQWVADHVRRLVPSVAALRAAWSHQTERETLEDALSQHGITPQQLAEVLQQPAADPFDLLCYLAFEVPPRTRAERARRVREQEAAFFAAYSAKARAVLDEMLRKYEEIGPDQLRPDIVTVPPLTRFGSATEIAAHFGGVQPLMTAVRTLHERLYAA